MKKILFFSSIFLSIILFPGCDLIETMAQNATKECYEIKGDCTCWLSKSETAFSWQEGLYYLERFKICKQLN